MHRAGKIRSEVVARDVAWRDRHPRWSNHDARSLSWPEPATMHRFRDANLTTFEDDDVLHNPIIAGTIPNVNVNEELLDFSRDVVIGQSTITREPPVLPRMGRIQFVTEHPYLDDRFQRGQMGIANISRRIPIIYEIGLDFILDSAAIGNAVSAIENSPMMVKLRTIDDDEEFIDWYGSAPDFHPRVRTNGYQLDQNLVRLNIVEGLLKRIDAVPVTMVKATIALYNDQIRSGLSGGGGAVLQQKIDALEAYLKRLGKRRAGGAALTKLLPEER